MTVHPLHHADFFHGRWEDVLQGVSCDAVIADPPYSARTHDGHDDGAEFANHKAKYMRPGAQRVDTSRPRRAIEYASWTAADVDAFVDSWAPRNRGWFVCLSDNELCSAYRMAFERNGLTGFAPVGILIPGMTVRMAGDGPSSWMIYANVARPKALHKWGTLPGGYTGPPGERVHVGGKALWLMRALVRDYSRPGDVIADPVAGAATTLLAAMQENRLAIGAEADLETWKVGMARIKSGYTPTFDFGGNP
jgi:site-specific DNA-methyltransferase (adenine-specific)